MGSTRPSGRAEGDDPPSEERLAVGLLGPMRLSRRGAEIVMPGSRKVRGLLAYLLMARRPLHRARLCEVFWDGPDDPRRDLRWCLSKLRGVRERLSHHLDRTLPPDRLERLMREEAQWPSDEAARHARLSSLPCRSR